MGQTASLRSCGERTGHRIVEQKISTDRIVVLTTRAPEKSPLHRAERLGNTTLVPLGHATGPGEVRFTSLHKFKGLESDVVILCDIDPGSYSSSPNHLYVGESRARHLLIVARYAEAGRGTHEE